MKEISQIFFRLYDKVMLLHQNNTNITAVSIPEMTVNDEYYLELLYRLGEPTFTEFSEAARITKPAATQIMKRFIEKGYVQKIQLAQDRRVYHLKPADRVKDYFKESDQLLDEIFEECLSVLDKKEVTQLNQIFTKIDAGLED